MKKYKNVEVEVINLDGLDIITTSDLLPDNNTDTGLNIDEKNDNF